MDITVVASHRLQLFLPPSPKWGVWRWKEMGEKVREMKRVMKIGTEGKKEERWGEGERGEGRGEWQKVGLQLCIYMCILPSP